MTTQSRDLIAIPDTACAMDEAAVRQLAIMFDRIAIPPLRFMNNNTDESPETKKTRAWLVATGILFEQQFDALSKYIGSNDRKSFEPLVADADVIFKPYGTSVEEMMAARGDREKIAEIKRRGDQVTPESMFSSVDPQKFVEAIQRVISDITRGLTIGFRITEKLDAYAVISGEHSSLDQEDVRTTKYDVLKFVFAFPVPDEDVPWQWIIEYRNDPESRNRFFMLKSCMSEIARGSLTPSQAEETLASLLDGYRRQMERHRLYIETKRMEVFVVTTVDVAAKFEGFDWHTVGQSVFAIEPRRLALLEGESTMPGSEVAFVIDSKSMFTSP